MASAKDERDRSVEGSGRSPRRRVVSFLLFPEVGRSVVPLREAGRSFVELWGLFRAGVRSARSRKEGGRRRLDAMGFWLLVVGGLCVLYAGGMLLSELLAFLIPEARGAGS